MKTRRSYYTPWLVLIIGVIAAVGGAFLLIELLGQWPVSPGSDRRPLFFLAVWLVLSGLALPLAWLLHRRFGRQDAGESWRSFAMLARQSIWWGVWGTGCLWLQMHRTFNWAMALLFLVVLVLVEALILTRQEAKQDL